MGDEGKIVAGVFGKIERRGRYDREIKLSICRNRCRIITDININEFRNAP